MRVRGRGPSAPPADLRGPAFGEVFGRAVDTAPPGPGWPTQSPALPELREAARAIPSAIWAGRLEGGATVELAFGSGVVVRLRQAPGGIELLVLAPGPLARALRGAIPALRETLRERGVDVVRAEVRGGPHGGSPEGSGADGGGLDGAGGEGGAAGASR